VSVFLSQFAGTQSTYAILHCHLWPVWFQHIFTNYLKNDKEFRGGKKLLNTKYVIWFSIQNFDWDISYFIRRTQRDIINVHRSPCKVNVIRVGFLLKLSLLDKSSVYVYTEILNLITVRPVEAEIFHADERRVKHEEFHIQLIQIWERLVYMLIQACESLVDSWIQIWECLVDVFFQTC